MPGHVIESIFANVESIQDISSYLLELMSSEGVVHALQKLAPYMKFYATYANNFEKANTVLEVNDLCALC